jgi:8-amino-7-oxononanoate synthase
VIAAATEALRTSGSGSGAAPLVTGHTTHHAELERTLADWKQTEDAVLLPSGYQANHAAIGAIANAAHAAGRGVRFLLDKLAHASLIDAVKATEIPFRVFPHNGIPKLARLLEESDPNQLQVVLTESIFSMDGDAADLPALAELKSRHAFLLLLDEAHATGLYAPDGAGRAAELNLRRSVDLALVTLSKALGNIGGAICASKTWCDAILNFGRAYLFSTSLPPHVAAAATAAIQVARTEPGRRTRVRQLVRQVRDALHSAGHQIPDGDSPIIPIILGDESAALAASARLRDQGLLVPAIRPPTVPRGTSRLRLTLCCDHTDEEITRLLSALRSPMA